MPLTARYAQACPACLRLIPVGAPIKGAPEKRWVHFECTVPTPLPSNWKWRGQRAVQGGRQTSFRRRG